MNKAIKILLVEKNSDDAELIQGILKEKEGKTSFFKITHVDRVFEAMQLLEKNDFDLILLDLSLPDSNGIDTFRKVHLKNSDLPIILLTGLDDETLALQLIQEGAQDYLLKGQINNKILIKSICYAFERYNKNREEVQKKYKVIKNKLAEYTITEKEILVLLADGMSREKIAEKLHLSLSVIKNHMSEIFTKLRLSTVH